MLVLGGGFGAMIFAYPIQLVGEIDGFCLFEQDCNPLFVFVSLYYGRVGIHHITDSTL